MQHNFQGHGVNSNNYCPEEVQSQPTTSNNQVTCIYKEPNSKTYTDGLTTETNKVMEEPDGTDKIQSNVLAPEVPRAEQLSQKTGPFKRQSTRQPKAPSRFASQTRSKKSKDKKKILRKRAPKRLHKKPSSKPKQSKDVNEDFTNEFDVFGRFLAMQLKNLSGDDAVLAQSEIQEVLIRYTLNKIKSRYGVPTEHTQSVSESKQSNNRSDLATVEEVLVKCEPYSE